MNLGGSINNVVNRATDFLQDPAAALPRDIRNPGRWLGATWQDFARNPEQYGTMDFKDLVDGSILAHTAGVWGGGDREHGGMLLGAALGGGPLAAELGGLGGWYLGSQEKQRMADEAAMNQQEEAARAQGEQQAAQIAQVRNAYGYLAPGMTGLGRAAIQGRRAGLGSAIEGDAAALRDASLDQITGGAQAAAVDAKQSAARSGLFGSSIDQQNRKNVLQSFLSGRAGTASEVQGQRQQAWGNLDHERLQMENAVRSTGNAGLEQMFAAQKGANAIAAARRNVLPAMFGNLLGTGGQVAAQGAVMGAQGSPGLGAFGLPGIAGSGNKTAGATGT